MVILTSAGMMKNSGADTRHAQGLSGKSPPAHSSGGAVRQEQEMGRGFQSVSKDVLTKGRGISQSRRVITPSSYEIHS